MQFNIPAEHKNASGVYIIRNSVNAKVYVGSAVDFWKRYRKHRNNLKNTNHHSLPLQRFVDKYESKILRFELLEVIALCKVALLEAEQKWIIHYESSDRKKGFNMAPAAGSLLGYKHPFRKRAPHSEETRRIMSENRKRNPILLTPEQRERQRTAVSAASRLRKGKPATPRTPEQEERRIASVRAANTGRKMPEEHKKKLSDARKGKKRDPAIGEKISQAHRARKAAGLPVGRAKGTKLTEVQKAKMPRRIVSEESRLRMSEAQKNRYAIHRTSHNAE